MIKELKKLSPKKESASLFYGKDYQHDLTIETGHAVMISNLDTTYAPYAVEADLLYFNFGATGVETIHIAFDSTDWDIDDWK